MTQAQVFIGPNPFRKSVAVIPRETVLTARRLREWSGWGPADIAAVLGLQHEYARNICRWALRADIDPGPRPHPASEIGQFWAREVARFSQQLKGE